ncbi:hypothetical protein [Streptomyces finlayi]|uniref:hypothetical protein n=1 Tax=Streptomyces finlayi TaxID=67296 RepID=UPI0027E5275B|nr:hypothetical protein [Streptomyces finlayi]
MGATNSIRSLDRAFLRPGRFDCLVPVGTPEAAARTAPQAAFEREVAEAGADTHHLAALGQCRPTVTPAVVAEFTADITPHART